jgi:molybdenum cofactor cytidylyltransferase
VNIGAIILAAGGSTRLGSPKQLLLYAGEAFIRRAAQLALAASCRPVIVVLGSSAEQVRVPLAQLDVELVANASWQQGIGTSVRLGIETLLLTDAAVAAALLMVCDQPFVNAADLGRLIAGFQSVPNDETIVAAQYNATIGVPAIFGRGHFAALAELPDDAGAKRVLLAHRQSVIAVEMPNAAVDIDTREQYRKLTQDDGGIDSCGKASM